MAAIKILHLLAMASGVGFGLAGLVIARVSAGADPAATPTVMKIRMRLGQGGFLSLVILWATGIWLWQTTHGGAVSALFLSKIAVVILLTMLSGWMNVISLRAARGGPRPDPARMAQMARAATALAVLAVILAGLAFGT
ncbi:hypothetical protein PGB28_00405 [Primorskyibacter aestuariivivens]|uniref:hypothetical protein n=1 Tax=Primorskyibacter aestuariivivens TaxID=1888912 RepID=UPI0023003337|nr:hypothetical protein [Primorskyibacter aestuariivivens]MDA7426899.1 hypothetical protein [Primorskyibacter aestuariivivens]